jgi:AcrR family transcriptional regulator
MAPKISEKAKKAKKDIIIQEALKLFSQNGYVETSMDDIVVASQISKGGIYNYFKSKEEIFLAIAEDRFNKRHDLIEGFPENTLNKEKLIKYIHWTLRGLFNEETSLNARFTFEFWSVLSRNEKSSEKAKERYNLFYNDLAKILIAGIENGEFKNDLDVDSITYIILSTMDGISFCNSVMKVPITEDIVNNYVDIMLNKVLKELI